MKKGERKKMRKGKREWQTNLNLRTNLNKSSDSALKKGVDNKEYAEKNKHLNQLLACKGT